MSSVIDTIVTRGRVVKSAQPKRILFYGACHATIFRRVYENFCTDESYSFDKITNFDIINRGIPFPYDQVSEWDIIVFSPILRRAGYETVRLIDACIKNNVKYFSYPHLHWRGYFPYIKEDYFVNMRTWHYPKSISLAGEYEDFATYLNEFSKPFKNVDEILSNLESSTEALRKNEILGECNFKISDYVIEEYKNRRLFLIPGHPSQALYIEAIKRLNEHLNLPIDPSYFYSALEPQGGVKVPIHPDVSESLELKFHDADFQNNTSSFADRNISWTDYMRLSYGCGRGSTMWQANAGTSIKCALQPSNTLKDDECIRVSRGTILQARKLPTKDSSHWQLDISWADPGLRRKLQNWDNVYIYKNHWQETVHPAK